MRLIRLSLFGLLLASACADDSTQQASAPAIGNDGSRIHSGTLTGPSTARAADVVRDYLAGFVGGAADQMTLVSQTSTVRGVSHLRFEQQVGGLRVYGAYVKAAINDRGELVHVIENLAPAGALPRPATISSTDALRTAMTEQGFENSGEFYRTPNVERVAYRAGNKLEQGFLVETWALRGNQLDHTLIGRDGQVISTELRTANDSYNVFTEDPDKGAQGVVAGNNWLSGTQTSQNISGPNVHAYLDSDANNQPDGGGTPVTDGNFLAVANLAAAPNSGANKDVAAQNLFYLNNVLHDRLAEVGFTAGNGNFEGNDPVNAEAQDGSGTDNANFSTPADGSSPRMQMYLWTGRTPTVTVNDAGGYQSAFGPAFTTTPLTGTYVRTTPADGCTAIAPISAGAVALIDRGSCDFVLKVTNAQNAGAVAVIIANNTDGTPFAPGGTARKIRIPSAMVSRADGATLAGSASIVKYTGPAALMRDGDIDSDIVFHEYGHGLTWRMIGGMSGSMSGAIGEGASDTLAFLLNGDGRIGEYSWTDPLGIRRAPYDAFTLSYSAVDGAEVHNDGEIYAAAMFRVLQNYQAAGLTAQDLLADWVNSMNFINASPNYEAMRDGLVNHVSADRACHVWRGFASLGIGQGSSSQQVFSKGKYKVVTTSSSTVPPGC